MTPERWNQIADLYDRALDCPASDRKGPLHGACQHDAALREEVDRMLAADAQAGLLGTPAWMKMPELVADSAAEQRTAFSAGTQVGPYRLVRPLGRGGMGEVFLATRDVGAARQTVAVKLLRPGLEEDRLLRRFAAEQQIRAQLAHPRIARQRPLGDLPQLRAPARQPDPVRRGRAGL